MGDDVYPTFLYDDGQDIDLFNLISAPNPTKVKTGTRPRAAYEVQDRLSGEIPPVENTAVTEVIPELDMGREVAAMGPFVNKRHRKRGNDEAYANAPPKVLRKDHAASRPTQSTLEGKSLASMGLEAGSTYSIPASSSKGAATAGDLDSEKSSSFTSIVGSLGSIYQPGWGVTNNCRLDTPNVCQDMVDHIVPPGYFLELHYLSNDDFLSQYNINMARQVAMGSQLRLRIQAREEEIKKLDQEIKSLRVVDTEVQGLRNQMRNLETLLEAEVDMKKAAEAKNTELTKELESLRAQFTDLQVNNDRLSQQVSTLWAQVTGEERIKAAFKEFKKYEDDWVNFRYAKMDARLDALSVDFDEELYPHMLIAIAGRRWVIRHGLRLAVMKCAESTELSQVFSDVVSTEIAKGMSKGLKHGVEHEKAKLDLEAIEAYDPEADTKYVVALYALKDLKYPIVDQMEKLKDASIDVVMALYLESDSREDAPRWIRELRPSSSQLKIPVYPKVRDPKDSWSFKEEILLADAIAANISHAEKKKKCRVVCRTHGVDSAHHARSDGVPVSVPTVAPQDLAILLADAASKGYQSQKEQKRDKTDKKRKRQVIKRRKSMKTQLSSAKDQY
ncbi:hypothetical protein Tco_1570079 [Tanacetum coccineum]